MPYTGLGLNHSVSTALGPGRLAKRQNLNTSDSRYQAPKNSAKPISIRYGVGLFSHLPTRYVSSSHAPISPADADCFTLDMKRTRPPSGGRVHFRFQSLRQVAGSVILPSGYLDGSCAWIRASGT